MKTPPRLLVDPGVLGGEPRVRLDAVESAHVSGALRGRAGDEVRLVDGAGAEAEAVLAEVSRRRVVVEIRAVQRFPEPGGVGVTVAMAVVERQPMDWAVQKAVEVGARRFVPLLSERTQNRGRDFSRQLEHWRRVARQAIKQCRRAWEMQVAEPRPPVELGEDLGPGRAVLADREGRPLSEIPDAAVGTLVVGPEGGFASSELELFDRLEWPRLRLGVHVLRAETAAVVGAAVLVARSQHVL